MMTNQHPDIEILIDYADSPNAKAFSPVRQHLIHCSDCRFQVDRLSTLQQDIVNAIPRMAFNVDSAQADALLDQKIEGLINNQLDETSQQQVSAQLKENNDALKSALHYATHSTAMQRHLAETAPRPKAEEINGNGVSLSQRLGRYIKAYLQKKTPLWRTAPAAIALSALLTIIILPLLNTPPAATNRIAVYQDNPVMHFKKGVLPNASIGFFGEANTMNIPYQGMKISAIAADEIHFSWPSVQNAKQYTLTLYQYSNNEKKRLFNRSTQPSQLELNIELNIEQKGMALENNQRYEWQLSGTTHDEQQFSTRGGFVYYQH